jgi:hypothetical protein
MIDKKRLPLMQCERHLVMLRYAMLETGVCAGKEKANV